jgi:indole-3-glycerol phosphate synthase
MAADRLQQILAAKEQEVARLLPKAELLRAAALPRRFSRLYRTPRSRCNRLAHRRVKKASPSAESSHPNSTRSTLRANAGASALCLRADRRTVFQGHLSHLTRVGRKSLPCLRKDFIILKSLYKRRLPVPMPCCSSSPRSNSRSSNTHRVADLQLDVLVEVHTEGTLSALDLGVHLLGINNRNLATFGSISRPGGLSESPRKRRPRR